MDIKRIGNNETIIRLSDSCEILFSYETPVAGYNTEKEYFKTDKYYSVTTSKHIGKYLKFAMREEVSIVPQSYIDGLCDRRSK